jgi:xanthine dehydrogenase accessory factor
VWLCTIISTYGSAPRPIGSIFSTTGYYRSGSISGGCIEDAFVKMIQNGELNKPIQCFNYGSQLLMDGNRYELPCGGHIQLLVEQLSPNDIGMIDACIESSESNQPFVRAINLSTSKRILANESNQYDADPNWCVWHYSRCYRLLLLGISLVSEEIAKLGKQIGFDVHICEIREDYLKNWSWNKEAHGIDVEVCSPDHFVEKYANTYSAILALAHDPRIDDLGMMCALESNAFYIGAMGSKNNSLKRRERLIRIGEYTEVEIARLHAPIGLSIGSKAPIEIAVSVLAEILQVKNKCNLTYCNYISNNNEK